MMNRFLVLLVVCGLSTAGRAQDVPLDKQKGVRGRVVVAPDLLKKPAALSVDRERALRGTAMVRRPLGRPLTPLVEAPPALVITLEGDGMRQDTTVVPKLTFEGMRFSPGSMVIPRPMAVQLENKHGSAITVVGTAGAVIAKVEPGQTSDVNLRPGMQLLSVQEMPFATAEVRVLENGRELTLRDGEIPLSNIPGGEYTLTFFHGAEPLRIQPLTVPESGLVFIDATVSALKVVEVSIKDASMRVALPPSSVGGDAVP